MSTSAPAVEPELVSCIVPAYNVQDYVGEAIGSILAQTYDPIEVLVIDDGSTDATATVARDFGDRIRVVSQPSSGPAATRNRGLNSTSGEFVAFLDGDDLWHADKLSRQMARFHSRADLQCCVAHVRNFWSAGHELEADYYEGHPHMQPFPGWASGTLVAHRSAFDRVGVFDPNLWFVDAQDWFQRARKQGVVMELLPDVLLFRRLHGTNITRRRNNDSRREWLSFVRAHRRRQAASA